MFKNFKSISNEHIVYEIIHDPIKPKWNPGLDADLMVLLETQNKIDHTEKLHKLVYLYIQSGSKGHIQTIRVSVSGNINVKCTYMKMYIVEMYINVHRNKMYRRSGSPKGDRDGEIALTMPTRKKYQTV